MDNQAYNPDDTINDIFAKLCGYKYSEHHAYIDCESIKKRLHDYLKMKAGEDYIDRHLGAAIRNIVINKILIDAGFESVSAKEKDRIMNNLIRSG